MRQKQGGITLLSFVITLAVVGFFAYVGMKLFPMYAEYYAVRNALTGLSNEPGVADMDPSKIQDLFFRRMDINYSEHVEPGDVNIERIDSGWKMTVDYEVRRELVGNLDVVGKFNASKDLTRRGSGE